MTKVKAFLGSLAVAAIVFGGAVPAVAGGDIADKQGFCKRVQGSCNGASECGGPHQAQLPNGQGKKC